METILEQNKLRLVDLEKLRVWSIIVTIFGDFSLTADSQISAAELMQIMEQIGIKPDAFRVAIHRLKGDNWISVTKRGRNSIYQLTPHGFEQTSQARRRIYANAPNMQNNPIIQILSNGTKTPDGCIQIAPRVCLGGPPADESLILNPTSNNIPDWIKDKIGPRELAAGYRRLAGVLTEIEVGSQISSLDQTVLRVLVVHRWRQLLLRQPDLPPRFFPADWPGETCRREVLGLLKQLKHRQI